MTNVNDSDVYTAIQIGRLYIDIDMKDKLTTDSNAEIDQIEPKEKSEAFRELEQLEQSVNNSEAQVQQMEAEVERMKQQLERMEQQAQNTRQQLLLKTNEYKRKYSPNEDSPDQWKNFHFRK